MFFSQANQSCALSRRQVEAAQRYVQKWTDIGLSQKASDRAVAEYGIKELYAHFKLSAPKVIWCQSPLAVMIAVHATCARLKGRGQLGRLGEWLHCALFSRNYKSFGKALDREIASNFAQTMLFEVREAVYLPLLAAVYQSVCRPIGDGCANAEREKQDGCSWDKAVQSAAVSARAALHYFDAPGMDMETYFSAARINWSDAVRWVDYGQHAAYWCAQYEFLAHECSVAAAGQAGVKGAIDLAKSAGWFVPCEKMCFISDRHNFLSLDEQGLLHQESGPAVTYPDGWSVYAWHGQRLPEYVIENPEKISAYRIDSHGDDAVRRIMIEKYGLKYWLELGAQVRHEDETGVLYHLERTDGRSETVVKVTNSTPEPDGRFKDYVLRVPPDVMTARDAVAWTFNLSGSGYAPVYET